MTECEEYRKAITLIKKWSDANKRGPYTLADRMHCVRKIIERLERRIANQDTSREGK